MKIVITGGTGFVGRHLAQTLIEHGHEVVLISRGYDQRDLALLNQPRVTLISIGIENEEQLVKAFQGCNAVAHCAGINREIGSQTYQKVHIEGTQNVVTAAQKAGIPKIAFLSFLRARPDCGSAYHESKWDAEEIIRSSVLDYTILKAGVIYGKGDHMLDHLSHAFYTFPVFGLVGFQEKPVCPAAVEDIVKIFEAALIENRLPNKTVAVIGPEKMTLETAVRRVATAVGKRPVYVRLPIWLHYCLGWICERLMKIPLIALAQVRILSESVSEPLPFAESLPDDLKPTHPFSESQIRKGLPEPKGFGCQDLSLRLS